LRWRPIAPTCWRFRTTPVRRRSSSEKETSGCTRLSTGSRGWRRASAATVRRTTRRKARSAGAIRRRARSTPGSSSAETIARFPANGDHESTTFPELAAEGGLRAFRHRGLWLTVNTPKELRVAQEHVEAHPEWLA